MYFPFTGFSDLASNKFNNFSLGDMGQIVIQSLCGLLRFKINVGFFHPARTDILFYKLQSFFHFLKGELGMLREKWKNPFLCLVAGVFRTSTVKTVLFVFRKTVTITWEE